MDGSGDHAGRVRLLFMPHGAAAGCGAFLLCGLGCMPGAACGRLCGAANFSAPSFQGNSSESDPGLFHFYMSHFLAVEFTLCSHCYWLMACCKAETSLPVSQIWCNFTGDGPFPIKLRKPHPRQQSSQSRRGRTKWAAVQSVR